MACVWSEMLREWDHQSQADEVVEFASKRILSRLNYKLEEVGATDGDTAGRSFHVRPL